MKLQKYLTETGTTDIIVENGPRIWQKLKKDCKPFLKEYKKTGHVGKRVIYRGSTAVGVDTKKFGGIRTVFPRADRHPKDMPPGLHNKFDNDFNDRHGWYPRSEGVFTTSKKSIALQYGKPFLFYPIGKYKYLWTEETDDLYSFADGNNLLNYDEDGKACCPNYKKDYSIGRKL